MGPDARYTTRRKPELKGWRFYPNKGSILKWFRWKSDLKTCIWPFLNPDQRYGKCQDFTIRRKMTCIPPINRTRLLNLIGVPLTIPKDFEKSFNMVKCPGFNGETIIIAAVRVTLPRKDGKRFRQRVQVKCPYCDGKWIPAGRFHQHAAVHMPKPYVPEEQCQSVSH